VTGWKLNGPREASELSTSVMPLMALPGENGKVALAGVYRVVGVARWETESLGASVANCFEGNVADMGDKVLPS
jgi:hypothetical protein